MAWNFHRVFFERAEVKSGEIEEITFSIFFQEKIQYDLKTVASETDLQSFQI